MFGFNKYYEEHLPHCNLTDALEFVSTEVIREVHHNRVFLSEFRLLPSNQYDIVLSWLWKDLLHLEDLLFSIHIEGHSEDTQFSLVAHTNLR
jgi:hypothetical protein